MWWISTFENIIRYYINRFALAAFNRNLAAFDDVLGADYAFGTGCYAAVFLTF